MSHAKCEHTAAVKLVATFKNGQTIRDIFEEIHPEWDAKTTMVECHGTMRAGSGVRGASASGEGGILIDWASPLEDLKDLGITSFAFRCTKINQASPQKPGSSRNAFDLLMASRQTGQRCQYPLTCLTFDKEDPCTI